jgi:CRISPR-associated endoribonuclease Cas6
MRLYSSLIRLTNLHAVTIHPPGGQHAHAAFLDVVRAADPVLSQTLHDLNGRKPFTVSPLMGLPKSLNHKEHKDHEGKSKGEIYLREGWECWLRVTILDDTLFKSFIDYFLNPDPTPSPSPSEKRRWRGGHVELPQIRLGDAQFGVSEILTTPGSHLWAGYIALEDLQKRLDEPAPESVILDLNSPTSFSLEKNHFELTPYPKLVFGNLATAWKAITGENMVEAVEKYAEKTWRLELHRTERKTLILHNHPQLGIVGRVEFRQVEYQDAPLARALNLLADLAFYTGLGRKTAQGMGMCRRAAG